MTNCATLGFSIMILRHGVIIPGNLGSLTMPSSPSSHDETIVTGDHNNRYKHIYLFEEGIG
jgi:hypothetical protein